MSNNPMGQQVRATKRITRSELMGCEPLTWEFHGPFFLDTFTVAEMHPPQINGKKTYVGFEESQPQ